jgi:hypothetical protein
MKKLLGGLLVGVMFVGSSAVAGDVYCIMIKSNIRGEMKVHRCDWFNSYEHCKKAADRVKGVCKLKSQL